MRFPFCVRFGIFLRFAIGCDDTEVVHREYDNAGFVCLVASERDIDAGSFAVGAIEAHVIFNPCESYCADVVSATCEATLESDVIRVTGAARVSQEVDPDGSCQGECQPVVAHCDLEPIGAGTYTLVFGDDTRVVTIPGRDEGCSDYHAPRSE